MGDEKIFLLPIRTSFIHRHETAGQWKVNATTTFGLATKEFHDSVPYFLKLSLGILCFDKMFVSFLLLPILVQVELIDSTIDRGNRHHLLDGSNLLFISVVVFHISYLHTDLPNNVHLCQS